MNSQSGFTLIELMIVIIIIGILVAVAVPNFIGASDRAKVASVKSNVHTVQTNLEAYNIDKGNYPVYSRDFESDTDSRNNMRHMVNPFYGGTTTAAAMNANTLAFCHGTGSTCETGKGSMVVMILSTRNGYNFLKNGGMASHVSVYHGSLMYFPMDGNNSWAGTSTWQQNALKRPVAGYGLFGLDNSNKVIRGTLIEQGTPIP